MNIENALLGIASLVFATGSAFASISLLTPEYINVLYVGETEWVCTRVPTCASGSTFDCRVQVPTVTGVLVVAVYDNNTPPTTCSLRQKSTSFPPPITKQKQIQFARNISF